MGYDSVIAEVSTIAKPNGSNVTFYALDSNNNPIAQTNNGVWGPQAGFAVTRNYDVTSNFTVNFSDAGKYTIVVKLKDLSSNDYIAEKTVNVNVTPVEQD